MKKCPYCAEDIQEEAGFCRYCGRDLVAKVKNNAQVTGGSLLIEPSFMEILYSFQGRIGRKTYWAGICILITMLSIVSFIVVVVTQPTSNESYTIIGVLVSCPFLVGSLALSVKRLHDLGYSGWMMLLNIIPVLGIWLDAVLGFRKGIKGRNNYGGEPTTNILFEKVGTILGVLFLVLIALIVIVMYLNPSPTKQILIPTSYPTLKPTAVPTVRVETKPTSSCIKWDQVTASMEGQKVLCVYGDVVDYVENPTLNATYFYFGTREQFFLVASDVFFPNFEDGDCAQASGVIQLSTYQIPYIKIKELFVCDGIISFTPTKRSDFSGCPEGCVVHQSGCDIKGNVSFSSGEKIYYVPGQGYYEVTKIDTAYGERWFCTEDEARLAGWSKAKN